MLPIKVDEQKPVLPAFPARVRRAQRDIRPSCQCHSALGGGAARYTYNLLALRPSYKELIIPLWDSVLSSS